MKVVLASKNPHKLVEISKITEKFGFELVLQSELGVDIDAEGAVEIARRSRGTPRIANNLLRRVRDYAQIKHDNFITGEVAQESLSLLEIDPHGLDEMDRKILETICVK